MKNKLIELLKVLKLFPSTGYGEIVIKVEKNEIVLCEKKEKLKIEE